MFESDGADSFKCCLGAADDGLFIDAFTSLKQPDLFSLRLDLQDEHH